MLIVLKGVSVPVNATRCKDMSFFSNRIFKNLIFAVAIVNIVIMMVFGYGLPSPVALAEEINSENQTSQNTNTGTIESVEKETAAKEAEAVETALAREEVNNETQDEEEDEENETQRDPDAPILELTDDHIFLHVGDRFNYMSYIETMEDIDGSDLSRYIHLDKDVDTSIPGDIELTYRITSVITGKSDSKVLLITIEE